MMIDAEIIKLMRKVGFMVEAEAKRHCPVDTGRLRASISNTLNEVDGSVTIGSNVKYAPYVEFGTYKMNPQPYLRPAVDKVLERIKSVRRATP